MSDILKKKFTNDTLEEELREIVCSQLQEINELRVQIRELKRIIAEETKSKYNGYKKKLRP